MSYYEWFAKIIYTLDDVLWSTPFIIFVLVVGVYFFVKSKGFSIIHLHHIFKYTLGNVLKKSSDKKELKKKKGTVSPFEAVCIAIGGCVGGGNIAGVATAIATGGPGAILWMQIWAFLGMMVKLVEVSLSCYYRGKNEKGEYYGGTMYMLEKGVGEEQGHPRLAAVISVIFAIGFVCVFLGGSQAYNVSEVLNKSFGVDMFLVTVIYTLIIYYTIWKGTPRIAKMATRIVPFMCTLYLVGGAILIIVNAGNIPAMVVEIFKGAFTGTSAVGGFTGATVKTVISRGVARSMNSNEAGEGSSPLVHGSANTVHPVREGLWGSFEVFIDTIVVCSITALAILCTGKWTSGVTGASLTIDAFSSVFGRGGEVFIGIMMILFGLTTTAGWFVYYTTVIKWLFRKWPKVRDRICTVFKFVFPLPNMIIVWSITRGGYNADLFWAIVDLTLIVPVFANLIALVLLRKKFWVLLKDYKARYMGIGSTDTDFKPFYDTEVTTIDKDLEKSKHLEDIDEMSL